MNNNHKGINFEDFLKEENIDIDLIKENQHLKQENEKLKKKLVSCFEGDFCSICVAKDKCNNCCCYEQLKEVIYET